ncbi:MAG: PDZ domain-containing protein [Desulfobulbaceae bacterium]|nr:PDZ domain-containing protein [Desulfobulbaceae bacterium]
MRNTFYLISLTTLLLAGCATAQPPAPRSVTSAPTVPAATVPAMSAAAPQAAPAAVVPSPPVPEPKPRATGTPEDARRHMLRGMAAIEMAKSQAELTLAEEEFRIATEIAPDMANAWFNLGKVQTQLGRFAEAIASYRQYLVLAPHAEDAPRVRDELVKLEFRQELEDKSQARAGAWVGKDGTYYLLTLDGNRLTLKTDQRRVPETEIRSTYSLVGNVPVTVPVRTEYQLVLQGNRLSGTWSRGAVQADKCTVPPDTAPVTGELKDSEKMMVLSHERTSFLAATQMSLMGDDSCSKVEALGRQTVEDIIYGPLGKGGLGIVVGGLTQWWDGGFSAIQFGWQGRMSVSVVQPESPAYVAGLRDGDEILAIDGVAVKSLSAGEAVMRLRGEPGSSVTLELWRKVSNETFTLNFNRIDLTSQVKGGATGK